MEIIGKIITAIFDALLVPFGKTHQTLGLVWLSLLAGVGMAFVFKYTSNQRKIKLAKDRIKSYILEMRIYQDSLGGILHGLFGALRGNIVYLAYTFKPVLFMIVPFMIMFMQMDEMYGRAPLPVGSSTLLTVVLKDGNDPFKVPASLECGSGLSLAAGPVRVRESREYNWRLSVESSGIHSIDVSIGGSSYIVPVVASPAYKMIGHTRSASPFIEPFLHPALSPIPFGAPIQSVRLHYPGTFYPFLWWHLHWILIFVIYSLIGALVIKRLVGFEI